MNKLAGEWCALDGVPPLAREPEVAAERGKQRGLARFLAIAKFSTVKPTKRLEQPLVDMGG